MVIDVHSHLFMEIYQCDNLPKSTSGLKNFDLSDILKKISKSGIENIVVVVQDGSNTNKICLGSNLLAADLQSKSMGKFIGIGSFEPLDIYDNLNIESLDKLEYFIEKMKLKGLFFSPSYQRFSLCNCKIYPFYLKAYDFNIPLYFHLAALASPAKLSPLEYGQIHLLDQIAIDFPKLKINIEHMGFPWTEELFAIMEHAENIYTDISEIIMRRPYVTARNLALAKEYKVIDRVMYGSDYLGSNITEYLNKIEKETDWIKFELNNIIKKFGWPAISDKELDGILLNNALQFFNGTLSY